MKRLAVLLVFIFPAIKYLSAQTFQAGFYIGPTMTGMEGLEANNSNFFEHIGGTLAATVSTKIGHKTTLQMEIRYFERGAAQSPVYDSTTGTFNNYFRMNLYYMDAVIGVKHQVHFTVRNQDKDMYGIEGGVSVGYLLGYSYEVQSINYQLALHPIDISPFIGIYFNVTPHFYIEARYSNSVNSALVQDATKNPYFLYYSSFNDGHNFAFSLTLGFVFGKSRQ